MLCEGVERQSCLMLISKTSGARAPAAEALSNRPVRLGTYGDHGFTWVPALGIMANLGILLNYHYAAVSHMLGEPRSLIMASIQVDRMALDLARDQSQAESFLTNDLVARSGSYHLQYGLQGIREPSWRQTREQACCLPHSHVLNTILAIRFVKLVSSMSRIT